MSQAKARGLSEANRRFMAGAGVNHASGSATTCVQAGHISEVGRRLPAETETTHTRTGGASMAAVRATSGARGVVGGDTAESTGDATQSTKSTHTVAAAEGASGAKTERTIGTSGGVTAAESAGDAAQSTKNTHIAAVAGGTSDAQTEHMIGMDGSSAPRRQARGINDSVAIGMGEERETPPQPLLNACPQH